MNKQDGKKLIKKIIRDFMKTEKFKTVHEKLKKFQPDITKREVMESYLTLNGQNFFRNYLFPIMEKHGFKVETKEVEEMVTT